MEAKSQLFLKYFTLFMNLLNDCGDNGAGAQDEKDLMMGGHRAGMRTGSSSHHQMGGQNSLRNATIQAMSNLLSANIDSGLMHSIGLVGRIRNTKW